MTSKVFAIASRRSPLAQAQTRQIQALLGKALGAGEDELDLVLPVETFVTAGDKNLAGSLAEIGGKGLFTKEIEEALLSGAARFAVHSMKDMPAQSPAGLVTAAIPAREDPRDCFLSFVAPEPWDLPENAIIGAASVRRIAQILNRRPDLQPQTLRGNVGTRLEKLKNGEADATFLALAGLKRLGLAAEAVKIMPPGEMLPAVGQGALCIQARADDEDALALAAKISCSTSTICVAVERAFLAALDGSCRTPIAGLAVREGDEVWFRGELLSLDGADCFTVERRINFDTDDISAAEECGRKAAGALRTQAGADFMKRYSRI